VTLQLDGAAIDVSNNIYVVSDWPQSGQSTYGYQTYKYGSDGSLLWSASPTFEVNALAHALVVNNSQRVFLTGVIPSFYGTFALDTNGTTIYNDLYPATFSTMTSVGTAIAADSANNCYVTGYSPGANGTNNIVTIKYGPNGNQIWLEQYNAFDAGNDAGNSIAVDNNGNVYVTGYETLPGGGTGIVTIKYSPLTLQRKPDGTVLLETQGSPGESFDIEASADLLNWLDLGTVLADTNGLMQFDDTNAPNFPSRFYYTNPQ